MFILFTKYAEGNPWDQNTFLKTIVSNTTENKFLNVMRLPQALTASKSLVFLKAKIIIIDIMQRVYIQESFRILSQAFIEDLNSDFNNYMERRLILFILFTVLLIGMYVTIWIPWMNRLTDEVRRINIIVVDLNRSGGQNQL